MAAKTLLIAHGEKILVALVIILCLWFIYATISDPATQAKVTELEIDQFKTELEKAYNEPVSPNFAKPHDFLAALRSRLSQDPQPVPVLAFLNDHPDLGPSGPLPVDTRFHIYEIPEPRVLAEDNIGILFVQVELPQSQRFNDERDLIKSGPASVTWRRSEATGPVVNRAGTAGVLLEYHLGDGDWQPLRTDDYPTGVLPVTGGKLPEVVVSDVEAYATYHIRGRVVARVTGTTDPQQLEPGREVVPVTAPVEVRRSPQTNEEISGLASAFAAGALEDLAEPYTGPMPGAGEGRPFLGAPSPEVTVQTRPPVYMGFAQIRGGIGNAAPKAVLVLKRLFRDAQGNDEGWSEPFTFTVEPGDQVGEMVNGDIPGGGVGRIDLRTPFVVAQPDGIEKGIMRTYYWMVKTKNDVLPNGDRVKSFEVESYERPTAIVTLLNQKTGHTAKLLQFSVIRRPFPYWQRDFEPFQGEVVPPIYPIIPEGGIDESQLFEEAPREYRPPPLVPERPELRSDVKMLNELWGPRISPLLNPEYVVMPDGRVYAYHTVTKQVQMQVIPDSRFDREGMPAAGGLNREQPREEADEPLRRDRDEDRRDRQPEDDRRFDDDAELQRRAEEERRRLEDEERRRREIDPDNPYGGR